jgi:uncharacterized protein YgbK (DUF1537 family)
MIVVIADDFTGAAELGGIGFRQGLSVEIFLSPAATDTPFRPTTNPGLLVIATDTRSMGQEAAVKEMDKISGQLILLRPEWIYKKTDSVLRGHVVPEIKAHLKALGLKRALLIPANPALGRTISDGHYFLNGEPVHHSAFSIDPEFPVTSSDLQDMLHTRQEPVTVKKLSDELPDGGITVGEVASTEDLDAWVGRIGPATFLAGASGFFSALLKVRRPPAADLRVAPAASVPLAGSPSLFVSGSTFDKSRAAIRKIHAEGGPVSYMPANETLFDAWCEEVVTMIKDRGKAIVAIKDHGPNIHSASWLKAHMANMVQRLLEQRLPERVSVEELTIEGGATAYAILQKAGLRTFFPVQELAPGIVRMRVQEAPSLYITVKPGSYPWPESMTNDAI